MKTFENLEIGDKLYTYDSTRNSTVKSYTVNSIINNCTEYGAFVITVQDNLYGNIITITFFKDERPLTKLLLAGLLLTNNREEAYEFRGHVTSEINKNLRRNHKRTK